MRQLISLVITLKSVTFNSGSKDQLSSAGLLNFYSCRDSRTWINCLGMEQSHSEIKFYLSMYEF